MAMRVSRLPQQPVNADYRHLGHVMPVYLTTIKTVQVLLTFNRSNRNDTSISILRIELNVTTPHFEGTRHISCFAHQLPLCLLMFGYVMNQKKAELLTLLGTWDPY